MKRTVVILGIALAVAWTSVGLAARPSAALGSKAAPLPLAQIAAAGLKPTPIDAEIIPKGPLTLAWSQVAPPELVRYDVYFGSDQSPSLVSQNQEACEWTIAEPLPPGDYYWQVVVRSADGQEAAGPLCCFSVPQWLQAAVEGTEIQWVIQHPGTYSAMVSRIALRSNAPVSMHMDCSGDLTCADGSTIHTCYALGDDLRTVEEQGWTPAQTLDSTSFPIAPVWSSEGWGIRYLNLWQRLTVEKRNPTGEYENVVVITFLGEP